MGIKMHRAELEDLSDILALQGRAYQQEAMLYQDGSIPPLTQSLEELKGEFTQALLLKAVEGGKIIGSVRAEVFEGQCHIGRLIVEPTHQRRGIGRQLMGEIEKLFADQVQGFELFTGSKSEGNIRLYQALGYTITKQEVLSQQVTLVFLAKPAP